MQIELTSLEFILFNSLSFVLSLIKHYKWITITITIGEAEAEAVETTITITATTVITTKTTITMIMVTRTTAIAIQAASPLLLALALPMRPSMTESFTQTITIATISNTIQEVEELSRPTIIEEEAIEAIVITVVVVLDSIASLWRKILACNRKWIGNNISNTQ